MKELRQFTMARVGLGRTGNSLPTADLLDFQLAHARARDAVYYPFDAARLCRELHAMQLHSAARDRPEYLRRPDLGRRLNARSRLLLRPADHPYDLAFVVADGLSPLAVHCHAPALLEALRPHLAGWRMAPVMVVEQGRVAIGDEIGALLNASLSVVLIGERPGLSSPDSLGVYLTWSPRPGRTDAERNCISNIRAEGLAIPAAAALLALLLAQSRARRLSGVALRPGERTLSG